MKNMKRTIITIAIITIFLVLTLVSISFADGTNINPSDYKPQSTTEATGADNLLKIGNIIIGSLQVVGTVISVVAMLIIGIKYMLGSVEEKAQYKQTLQPYIIGAILVFGITNVLGAVVKIASKLF